VIARKIAGEPKTPPKEPSAPSPKTAPTATSRERDPRLPAVGTVLERAHNDVVHKVKVLDDGFEYRGERHRSLSAREADHRTGLERLLVLRIDLTVEGEVVKRGGAGMTDAPKA
jgi:hypothetical protein